MAGEVESMTLTATISSVHSLFCFVPFIVSKTPAHLNARILELSQEEPGKIVQQEKKSPNQTALDQI